MLFFFWSRWNPFLWVHLACHARFAGDKKNSFFFVLRFLSLFQRFSEIKKENAEIKKVLLSSVHPADGVVTTVVRPLSNDQL